jgi:predicted ferric reductase
MDGNTIDAQKHLPLKIVLAAIFGLGVVHAAVVSFRNLTGVPVEESASRWVIAFGRFMGNLALVAFMTQALTSSRSVLLDKAFGLDRMMKFHRAIGAAGLCLAFFHPMVVYGTALLKPGPSALELWPESIGALVLVVVWFLVVSSLFRTFLELRYEQWRRMHKAALSVVALLLVHMFIVQPELREPPLLIHWAAFLGVWGCAVTWMKGVAPALARPKTRFACSGIETLADNVTSITLEPAFDGSPRPHLPGQFAFLRFKSGAVPAEQHPFTIASDAGSGPSLQFLIKASGDFTSTLGNLRTGDEAEVDGPYGRFTPSRFGEVRRLVMIAGGIGITPMLSVLRSIRAGPVRVPAVLLWSCRTGSDFVCREELAELSGDVPELSLHYFATRGSESGDIRKGRIRADTLSDVLPAHEKGTHAMVCGPTAMMRDISKHLRSMGYPPSAVHTEEFVM